jgi:hypothetical protein
MTAGGLVTASLSASSARVARRFMAPVRHVAFWVVAWSAFALAEVWVILHFLLNGPVAPYPAVLVVFRIVGGLFAACGLVAWQRRPDNHSGRLMTATGFAFLASPLLLQFESPLLRTTGLLLRNVWLLLLVTILLTFLSGGRLRTRTDRILVGAVAVDLLIVTPLALMFAAVEGNLLLVRPDAEIARTVDTVYRALDLPISVIVAGVVATRWLKASRPGRRALLPSVAGSAWLLFFMAVLTAGLVGVRLPQAVFWILAFSVVMAPAASFNGALVRGLEILGPQDLQRGCIEVVSCRSDMADYVGDAPSGRGAGCPPFLVGEAAREVEHLGAFGAECGDHVRQVDGGEAIGHVIFFSGCEAGPRIACTAVS